MEIRRIFFPFIFLFCLFIFITTINISAQTWDFEAGADGWNFGLTGEAVDITDSISFSGLHSAAFRIPEDSDIGFIGVDGISPEIGQTFRFHFFLPADTSNIGSFSISMITETGTVSFEEFQLKDFNTGTWNEISYEIGPYDTETISLAFNLFSKSEGSPLVFIDLVTSDPEEQGIPVFGPPSNLSVNITGMKSADLSWTAPESTAGLEGYNLYTKWSPGSVNAEKEFHLSGNSGITNYTLEDLIPGSPFYFAVTAVDTMGRETPLSNEVLAETEDFEEHITFDFEEGLGNWNFFYSASGISTSSPGSVFSGTGAVQLELEGDIGWGFILNEELVPEPGRTFTFHILVPQDTSNIQGFSIGSNINDTTHFENTLIKYFEPGKWNQLSYVIPDYDTFSNLHFSIVSKTIGSPPVYLDLITSDFSEKGTAPFQPPSNLSYSEVTKTSARVDWDPVAWAGTISYEVYGLPTLSAAPAPLFLGTTVNTTFTHEALSPSLQYSYWIKAEDEFGRKSAFSEELMVVTEDFEMNATFDFETGNEGWTVNQGSLVRTETRSFSGVYSMEVSTGADKTYFELIDANTSEGGTPTLGSIMPGHTIKFHLWVSEEDTSKLGLIQVFSKDGNWGWNSTIYHIQQLEPNSWNVLTHTIPDSIVNLNSIGIEIQGKEAGVDPEASVYVDLMTTKWAPELRPHLTIPENIVGQNGLESYSISWDAVTGNESVSEYRIYSRAHESDEAFSMTGSAADTSFTAENIAEWTEWEVYVTAVNSMGFETLPSASVVVLSTGGLPVEDPTVVPESFKLYNNYPNPFNPSTQITFDVPKSGYITLRVFDISGRLVQTLINEKKSPGTHTVTFNTQNLASGIYIYRLEAESYVQTKRMTLIK